MNFLGNAMQVVSNAFQTMMTIIRNRSPLCNEIEERVFDEVLRSFFSCNGIRTDENNDWMAGLLSTPVVEMGLQCTSHLIRDVPETSSSFRRELQQSLTTQSQSFCDATTSGNQGNNVNCTSGILGENALGKLFRMLLVKPDTVCDCMSILDRLPKCRSNGVAATTANSNTPSTFVSQLYANNNYNNRNILLDGNRIRRYSCLAQDQLCPFFDNACDDRLRSLHSCLPTMAKFEEIALSSSSSSSSFSYDQCKNIMCHCENIDDGRINYAAQLMELPMADMCIKKAEDGASSSFAYKDVPKRYELLRSACGYISKDIYNNYTSTLVPPPGDEDNAEAATSNNDSVNVNENSGEINNNNDNDILASAATMGASNFELGNSRIVGQNNDYHSDNNNGNGLGLWIGLSALLLFIIVLLLLFIIRKERRSHRRQLRELQQAAAANNDNDDVVALKLSNKSSDKAIPPIQTVVTKDTCDHDDDNSSKTSNAQSLDP